MKNLDTLLNKIRLVKDERIKLGASIDSQEERITVEMKKLATLLGISNPLDLNTEAIDSFYEQAEKRIKELKNDLDKTAETYDKLYTETEELLEQAIGKLST